MTRLAEAKHPQARSRRMALQRMIKRQPARQVIVVEVGAINAIDHLSAGSTQRIQKGIVIADIIVRIIKLRSKDKQRGVGAVLPLPAPNHGRDVNSHARLVQNDLKTARSVIDGDAALTVSANQKLMALFVCVLSADLTGGDAGDDKIPP